MGEEKPKRSKEIKINDYGDEGGGGRKRREIVRIRKKKKKRSKKGWGTKTKKYGVLPVALIFHSGEISSSGGIISDKKRASKSTNLSFLRLGGRWVVNAFAGA